MENLENAAVGIGPSLAIVGHDEPASSAAKHSDSSKSKTACGHMPAGTAPSKSGIGNRAPRSGDR